MPKQHTAVEDADEIAETSENAHSRRLGRSEASLPRTAAQKEKEAADRTHMTVKAKPEPSPHKIRKS